MILDVAALATADRVFDIAVVGGGASGLVLAHTLSEQGFEVALLEAGGLKATRASQELYRGELADPLVHPRLDAYRVRAMGGSSRIWGGRAIPYDPIDFEPRGWVPGSGWPFGFETLEPYYERAVVEAEAGRYAYTPHCAMPGSREELVPGLDGPHITTTVERFSKPTNFWRRHGEALRAARNAHVFVNAAVTAIRLQPDGGSVSSIEVSAPGGTRHTLRARAYVLALGGLETTRLLLSSNDVKPAGIGNDHDLLGRNYMSHLCATAGIATFAGAQNDVAYDYERDGDGIYVRRRLWINADAQRAFGLLNTTFRTHLPDPGDPSHGDAILSAMFLVKNFVLYEYGRKFSESRVGWGDRSRHVGNILRQPAKLARFGTNWVRVRSLAERKMPSVVLGSSLNRYVMEFHAEQAPNPDSRLTLSQERDRLGIPQLKVDWRTTELDRQSLKGCYRVLAAELKRTGAGRLEYDEAELVARAHSHGIVGGHHIGTTRMSAHPRQGVVDPDCRVHGVGNLYVASASVFPTSSQANPTLTLIALGLRMVDHLAGTLRSARTAPLERPDTARLRLPASPIGEMQPSEAGP